MDHTVERELTVPARPEEVWASLAEPEWLGEDATIELRQAGEVRAGERDGFVEEADAPRRPGVLVERARRGGHSRGDRPRRGRRRHARARDRVAPAGDPGRRDWRSTSAGPAAERARGTAGGGWPARCADATATGRRRVRARCPTAPAGTSTRCSASAARPARPSSRASLRSAARRCRSTWASSPTRGWWPRGGPAARCSTAPRPSRCPTPWPGWPRWAGSGTTGWRRSSASWRGGRA